jgi:hypothetical protein
MLSCSSECGQTDVQRMTHTSADQARSARGQLFVIRGYCSELVPQEMFNCLHTFHRKPRCIVYTLGLLGSVFNAPTIDATLAVRQSKCVTKSTTLAKSRVLDLYQLFQCPSEA